MIVVVGNTKGGVGKSTIAVNITIARAIAGKKVVLVDGDEQQTSALFSALRMSENNHKDYDTEILNGKKIYNRMPDLLRQYDDIIIDVGGYDSESLRYSLLIADSLVMPVIPQNFSAWAIHDMGRIIKAANAAREKEGVKQLKTCAVLNKAALRTSKDNGVIAIDIEKAGLDLVPVVIVDRAVFNNAASVGKSILEHKPRNKMAIEEFSKLMYYVYS